MDEQSLSHTKWKCQYHIVIVPKYRRKAIYGKLRQDIGVILRKLCEYKHVEIIEAHAMPDHIHMLLSIPPKLSVGDFMGYLKGKSTLMIFERHANMKYKYGRIYGKNTSFLKDSAFIIQLTASAALCTYSINHLNKNCNRKIKFSRFINNLFAIQISHKTKSAVPKNSAVSALL